ncbi:MAG: choice-of-anchor D domain-containing protein [Actinobacteria bacterium]|nr:choice-of-anchor D domain-containing protein [Actinomycetota bacterium]
MALGMGALAHASAGPRPREEPPVVTTPPPVAEVYGAYPSVSDDGRFIVYQGKPTDGSGRQHTIWLRDAGAPAVDGAPAPDVELTVPTPEAKSGESVRPTISGDGCVVAVVTQIAYDLFRDDDTGNRYDVYSMVLPHCEGGQLGDWQLVSTQSSTDGDTHALDRVLPDEAPAVSQSGTVIAYSHFGRSNKDAVLGVSVVDLTKPLGVDGRTTRVAGTPLLPPNTTFLYHGQREPDVSDDGRFVTFTSDAVSSASVPEWGGGPVPGDYATSQVYLWDRDEVDPAAAVTLVSTVDGHPAKDGAGSPVISGDGRYVAYESISADMAGAASLPDCSATCPPQVYRYDQQARLNVLVSRENTPEGQTWVAADHGAAEPTISDDGTQVGFVTRSHNLFPTLSSAGVEPGDGEIVVAEVERGLVRRASTSGDGITPAPAVNAHPALSGPGHVIVFDTLAAGAFTGVEGVGRQVVAVARTPQLSVPALDVGTVALTYPGPEWYVGIRNEGPSTFMPTSVEMSNPDFTVTGGTCSLGLPVPPGDTCTVYLVLKPTVAGPITSDLTVSESIFGGTSVTSVVRGAGGEPALKNSAGQGDYPSTVVGKESQPISFEIANIGFAPTTIARIALTGDNPKDFKVTGTSCYGYLLNPGSTCSIDAIFKPTEPGYRSATMVVSTDLGQYTSVVVVGDATRVATLEVAEPKVRAGDDVGLGGSGFKPDALVNISWADGRGESITVTTDDEGSFLALLPTRPGERIGDRVVVAQSLDAVARVDVQITRRPGRR